MSDSANQLKVFVNTSIDTSSWNTVLDGLAANPTYSFVAFERGDDAAPLTALTYRYDSKALDYARKEDWDRCLRELQTNGFFTLFSHPHTDRLVGLVREHSKLWVAQHCIPQVNGNMSCASVSGSLFHGRVTTFLTKQAVEEAYARGLEAAHELLGREESWLGRGWVQQEVTARGRLINLDAYELFFQKGKESGDSRLASGGESLCILLRRMKGEAVEPLADRFIRFYAVNEADFTVEADRQINIPDFSDIGYVPFPIGCAPSGYRLQPEITVKGERVYMPDSNGSTVGKWFKRLALYVPA